jgi:uncharacterized protein
LEWNAMLAATLAEAAWRLDSARYADAAVLLVDSLFATHRVGDSWRRRSGPDAPLATSADLAWLIAALVSLFELDGNVEHLARAADVAEALLDGHWDGERPTPSRPDVGGGLFQSHRDVTGLLVRAKDVLDGAVPAGASIAAVAFARLGMCTSDPALTSVAERLVALGGPLLDAQPTAAPMLVEAGCLLDEGIEVAVPGPPGAGLAAARRAAPPFGVVVHGDAPIPLLADRADGAVYVCRHAACDAPLFEVASVAPALAHAARWEAEA